MKRISCGGLGWVGLVALLSVFVPGAARAQCADSTRLTTRRAADFVFLGSREADAMRLRNDLGACGGSASLIRSGLTMSHSLPGDTQTLRIAPIDPRLAMAWNSRIPQSFDDGALWAGRGASVDVTAGFRAERDNFTLVFAPELTTSANLATTTILPLDAGRSPFGSPWHSGRQSIDLPQRFGSGRYTQLGLGQSTLEARYRGAAGGFTSENQWWGPAIQNALVMSDNAAGIPQVYVRSAQPIHTRIGDVEGRWLLGMLTESPYFDNIRPNDLRSLSAAVVTVRTALDTGLTIGMARSVYSAIHTQAHLWSHWANVLTDWATEAPEQGTQGNNKEQITSLFARWVFPESGLEVYGEWAKLTLPKSLTELIVDPQRDQGYTMGLQWVDPLSGGAMLRLQSELTMLEHSPDPNQGLTPSFYLSETVVQGYTQRGQVIGAAIGPGSSTQWIAADLIHPRWQIGATVGRVRWDDDAYYALPGEHYYFTHDIGLYAGARGALTFARGEISAQLTDTKRLNYLFQTPNLGVTWSDRFDVRNVTLDLAFIPRF